MTGAYVLLEDGTRFDGEAAGALEPATGEVVFTTGMSGYQEAMTDPSFHGQLIVFTYPHIGNYGVSADGMESDRIHAAGAIMREAANADDAAGAEGGWLDWLETGGVPALTGVDTRALVRHIRDRGAMRGGIFPADVPESQAREQVLAEPGMNGRDLARVVTPERATTLGSGELRIAALDTGIKTSIVRNFVDRGVTLELHPCTTTAEELLASDPHGVFLVPGPGDPAALDYIVGTIRGLLGRKPVFGICLGHQLLSRAVGLETYKLPFGHHGSNHPVKDLRTGRIAITSQNHGFAVEGRLEDAPVRLDTNYGAVELTRFNLYDGTVEGLRLLDVPAGCVQYHPEAGPGPNDSLGLFDEFVTEIRDAA